MCAGERPTNGTHFRACPRSRSGCACVSTDAQDLTAQRDALQALGVQPDRIYVDHGFTGATRAARPR
jgi:Resolvase, N terminal domain